MRPRIAIFVGTMIPSHRQMLAGIADYVAEQQLDWELLPITRDEHSQPLAWASLPPDLDGFIGYREADWIAWCRARDKPVVLLSNDAMPGRPEVEIRLDRIATGELAARYAHERGFRDVAVLQRRNDNARIAEYYEAFFRKARTLGMRTHRFDFPNVPVGDEEIFETTRLAWIRAQPPRMLAFFHQDRPAAWFLDRAKLLGLRIPEEISVLGVDDNISICEGRLPGLASIALPNHHIGHTAALSLHRLLSGATIDRRHITVRPLHVTERASVARPPIADPLVRQALKRMATAEGMRRSIAELARALGISTATLRRRFELQTGTGPKAAQLRMRLSQAERLLAETDHPIEVIAQRCGFTSRVRFTAAFKKRSGMTPTRFRTLG